jgi:hypothetical protein
LLSCKSIKKMKMEIFSMNLIKIMNGKQYSCQSFLFTPSSEY